ncbi:hypothetical protein [Novosphingobium sp. TCA1]|uniref:hypothetical protein n=1 Tax=Novosphingobium sp. TCA1 TaxID=2682474 RepID=UPI0013585C3D|nr:hypothetical protein [Novosphingobium sp. TCA1]
MRIPAMKHFVLPAALLSAGAMSEPARAQEAEPPSGTGASAASDGQALADQLANPVSSLISVPLQSNYDCCYGPAGGDRYTLNIQPVIPLGLSKDWNLITRTILPVISQEETVRGAGGDTGLGDTLQSFFLSPKAAKNGIVWGVGPAILWPTGKSTFTADKFGAGPTAVLLKQNRGLTYGFLANHIWSFAGKSSANSVSQTFMQPFITKTLPDSTSFALNTETSYDWKNKDWVVPVNLSVSHVVKFGKQPVSLGVGARYYPERARNGPEWGARFVMTLLFPE